MKQSYFAGVWKPEYEPLIELSAGFTKHPDYPRVAWASALTYDMTFTQPVVDVLPNLKVPTLLVVGRRRTSGRSLRRLSRRAVRLSARSATVT